MIFGPNRAPFLIFFFGLTLLFQFSCVENGSVSKDFIELGRSEMERHEFGKAINSFKKAIEQNPTDSTVYCYLGKSYIWYLRFNAAILLKDKEQKNDILNKVAVAYQKSLELNPNSICAYEGLGEYYSYIDDYENSLIHYQKAALLNPEDRKIYKAIGRVFIELDKPGLAKEAFRTYLKGSKSSADYKKVYKFISKDKIRIDNGEVFLESIVKWRITDPTIYEGSVGYFKGAESRMKDLYFAGVRLVLSCSKNESDILSVESKRQIIDQVNKYSLRKFGIEVSDISVNIIKGRG